jgi:hypothetical protein
LGFSQEENVSRFSARKYERRRGKKKVEEERKEKRQPDLESLVAGRDEGAEVASGARSGLAAIV